MGRKPKTAPESLEIEHALHRKPGYLIRRLQQMAVSIFLEETERFDITPVQYATLAAVNVYPGIDQLRVANAIGFDRTTISGVIDRLEAKGFLQRLPSKVDRRAKELLTTPAGRKLLQAIEDSTNRVQARILAPLPAAEKKAFLQSLERLVLFHNSASRVPVNRDLFPGSRPASSKNAPRKQKPSKR